MYKDKKPVAAYDGTIIVGVFPSIRQAGWYMYLTGETGNINSASANICRAYKTGKSAFGYDWKLVTANEEASASGLKLNIKYNQLVASGDIPVGDPTKKSNRRRGVELYQLGKLIESYPSISQAVREAERYIPEDRLVWLRYSLNGYYNNTGVTKYRSYSWKVEERN